MNNIEMLKEQYARACHNLENNHGFISLGNWLFSKGGKVYDLSAADLSQIERIEREGLFVVGQ